MNMVGVVFKDGCYYPALFNSNGEFVNIIGLKTGNMTYEEACKEAFNNVEMRKENNIHRRLLGMYPAAKCVHMGMRVKLEDVSPFQGFRILTN